MRDLHGTAQGAGMAVVDHERAVIFSVLSDHVKMHVFPLHRDRKQLKTLPLCSTKIIVCPLCSRVFIVFSLSPVWDSDMLRRARRATRCGSPPTAKTGVVDAA